MKKKRQNRNAKFVIILMLVIILTSAVFAETNVSLNYVYNGTDWIPWLSTADGKPKVDLNLLNITAGKLIVDGTTFYVDSDNDRVGIGTTQPTSTLHIIGNLNATTNISSPKFCIGSSCRTTWPSGSGTGKQGDGVYLYNDTDTMYLNETKLNTTIEAIDTNVSLFYGYNASESTFRPVGITSNGALKMSIVEQSGLSGWVDDGSNVRLATTSDRVGIGTTSPTHELHVVGDANITGTVYAHNFSGNSDIVFINSSGEQLMTLTESGNVGIGTTSPGSFASIAQNLVVGDGSGNNGISIYTGASSAASIVFTNASDSNENYKINVDFGNKDMAFKVNGGTKMLIDDNGNVGIGTTSPDAQLTVSGGEATDGIINLWTDDGDDNADKFRFRVDTGDYFLIEDYDTGTWDPRFFLYRDGGVIHRASEGTHMTFELAADQGDDNADRWQMESRTTGELGIQHYGSGSWVEHLTIENTTGNVGIGDSTPTRMLDIYKGQNAATGIFVGNFNIHADADAMLTLMSEAGGGDPFITLSQGGGGPDWNLGVDNSDSDKFKISGGADANADLETNTRFTIATDGTFTGSASNDISDMRLKENITEVESALDKITQLRGVRFTWKKEANMHDRPQFGVLAQEVEEIFPELVLNTSIFGDDYKSVQYSGFVAPLIEAIKELKTEKDFEIEQLKQLICLDHPEAEVCQ